ncbi:hypothetical protein ATO13_23196 [Stappia sp. 22II-S9-Z10]|nr:hypothetical protein ATO13_23196 [Stappia sp. 22II-S9-Z10]
MGAQRNGELMFQALGRNLILVFDFNALCTIEDELDVAVSELQAVMQSPRMKQIRTIFRVGLSRHQPNVDDIVAGEIIGDVGMQRAANLIGEAFAAAFPQADGEGGGSTGSRPPVSA